MRFNTLQSIKENNGGLELKELKANICPRVKQIWTTLQEMSPMFLYF